MLSSTLRDLAELRVGVVQARHEGRESRGEGAGEGRESGRRTGGAAALFVVLPERVLYLP